MSELSIITRNRVQNFTEHYVFVEIVNPKVDTGTVKCISLFIFIQSLYFTWRSPLRNQEALKCLESRNENLFSILKGTENNLKELLYFS